MNKLGHVSVLVKDLDEALDFYTNKLNFKVETDVKMGNYRWLTIKAPDQTDFGIVLVLAENEAEKNMVGNQAAGRVLLTLRTDDCRRDYEFFKSRGVKFKSEPKEMGYGIDVVFEDLYGNRFDLVQVKE